MEKQKMIDYLYFCAGQCSHCYDACHLEHDSEMGKCMMNDEDCIEICRLAGHVMERNSENEDIFLRLCADMCRRCADECEKYPDFAHCVDCANACRECAEMCLEYVKA